jgi:hypothetical protein
LVIEMILVGGKQRSVTEFRELAAAAGLEVRAAGLLRSGRFAVECQSVLPVTG